MERGIEMKYIKWNYELIKEFVKNLGYELISKEYIGNKTKLILKDKDGYYYYSNFSNIQNNRVPHKFYTSNPYTIQNINLWVIISRKKFKLISEIYESDSIKLKWKCLKEDCGEVFEMNWEHVKMGNNCPYCNGKQVGLSNCLATKTPELSSQWHSTLNGNLTPYNTTVSSGKRVWWKCEKGHEWNTSVADRYKGNGCPYCSGLYPTETNNLLSNNPKLCEEWDYSKNKKKPKEYTLCSSQKVWWKCKKCGYEWEITINSRNGSRKTGCPKCNKSKGESNIEDFCIDNNIIYTPQYRIKECKDKASLPFDFAVFDVDNNLQILIEFQGMQHYSIIKIIWEDTNEMFLERQRKDLIKHAHCKDENIPLLIVPFYCIDKINNILNNILITNKEKISWKYINKINNNLLENTQNKIFDYAKRSMCT